MAELAFEVGTVTRLWEEVGEEHVVVSYPDGHEASGLPAADFDTDP